VAQFHVKDTFEIDNERLFVIAGSVEDGEIVPGMYVHTPLQIGRLTARIHSVEFALRKGGFEDVCVCFEFGPETLKVCRNLHVADSMLEISLDGHKEEA